MKAPATYIQNDLSSTGARMAIFWGPGVLLLILTGGFGWRERTVAWTAGLIWLAVMCFWNSARCQRVHCMFTGPFFLIMAVITSLVGFRVISLGARPWNLLSAAILIGGVVLCFGPELLWGRYWHGADQDAMREGQPDQR
ncbi:MAG TPA: hypothetical protein VIW95_10775 [Candidatus Binatus sp.]|uniref:hypothetical protein n=1 Tax=Candidatus Binatus sp. TaxID=2811406 RepID=UPI002F3E9C2A